MQTLETFSIQLPEIMLIYKRSRIEIDERMQQWRKELEITMQKKACTTVIAYNRRRRKFEAIVMKAWKKN